MQILCECIRVITCECIYLFAFACKTLLAFSYLVACVVITGTHLLSAGVPRRAYLVSPAQTLKFALPKSRQKVDFFKIKNKYQNEMFWHNLRVAVFGRGWPVETQFF